MTHAAAVAAGEVAENVASRSRCLRRSAPGRELIQPLPSELAPLEHDNSSLLYKSLSKCCSPPSRDATGGRASPSSIGASAAIFSCGQPLGVEERKTEGEREEGGAEAIAREEANGGVRMPQEMGGASFR